MKFSIVIPTIPRHHKFLPRLVKSLDTNSDYIHEIIIISSSTSEIAAHKLSALIKRFNLKVTVRIVSTTLKKTAGENRNSGWDVAESEYIMFLDADDWYSIDRPQIIAEVIKVTNTDFVIHNYWKFKPRWFLKKKIVLDPNVWISSKALIAATWEQGSRNVDLELGIKGDTNVIARDKDGYSLPIQHGHVTIRRSVVIRFSSRYGEDGMMIRDALEKGYEVFYIPNKLSVYNQISLESIIRSAFRYLRRLLLRK